MKPNLACNLTSSELKKRKETVIAELRKRMLDKVETADGYKYKFSGSDEMLDVLNNFIKTERMCCEFFVFTMTVSGDGRYAWLELSGPEGTKDFINQEINF